jgi:hypothetical protein
MVVVRSACLAVVLLLLILLLVVLLLMVLLLLVRLILGSAAVELRFEGRALALLMANLATRIAGPIVTTTLNAASASTLVSPISPAALTTTTASMISSSVAVSHIALATTEIAAPTEPTSSAEATAAIAPAASAAHVAAPDMAAVFEGSALADNLLKVVWAGKWLIHAEVFILVIAVLEAAALVLHGAIDGRRIDVSARAGGYVYRGLWRPIVVVVLPGSLLGLLFALELGLLLVVGKVDIASLLVVEVGGVGVLLRA